MEDRERRINTIKSYLDELDLPIYPTLFNKIKSDLKEKCDFSLERTSSEYALGRAWEEDGKYIIYLSDIIEDTWINYFLIHEMGHLLYGHTYVPDEYRDQINNRVKSLFQNKKYFIEELSDDDYYFLTDMIISHSMEMEVNSKVYTPEDVEITRDILDAIILKRIILGNPSDEETVYFNNWVNLGRSRYHLGKIVLPVYFRLEDKLSYKEYVEKILEKDTSEIMVYFKDFVEISNNTPLISIEDLKKKVLSVF